uniref:Uncharacterized protein n=1 Tax=Anguilla anguilla TaxID=7936 RepID=A0A0E9PBZ1_ANGAN
MRIPYDYEQSSDGHSTPNAQQFEIFWASLDLG